MGNKNSGIPSAALLRLDGTQVDTEGNITKTDFFNFLEIPLGDYSNLEKAMTPAAALKFRNHVVRMRYGTSAAIPMVCPGNKKCPMRNRCPFSEIQTFPIGEPCPLEVNLVQVWTKNYIEEFSVDTESITAMSLLNRLVELDLLDYRANIGLSGVRDEEAPTLLKTTFMETDKSTMETVAMHPLIDAKSRFHNERTKILEALVATPREKYRKDQALGQKQESDAAQHMAKMSALVKKLKSKTEESAIAEMREEAKELEEENKKNNIIETDWEAKDF